MASRCVSTLFLLLSIFLVDVEWVYGRSAPAREFGVYQPSPSGGSSPDIIPASPNTPSGGSPSGGSSPYPSAPSGSSPAGGTPDYSPPSSGSSPVVQTPPGYTPPSSGSSPVVETPPDVSPPSYTPPASGNSPVGGTPPDFTPPSSGSSPVGETPTPATYVPPSSGSSPDVETPPLSPPYSGSPASCSSPLVGSPLSSPLGGSPISSPDVGSPLTSPTPFVPTPTSPSGGSGGYGGKGSCGFWSHHDLKFPSILSALTSLGKVFGGRALNIFGSQMTLMQALVNSNQDDYSNLARQGTASLLNSYAYAGEFSLTPEQVLDGFNKALDSPESALQQAALFERANNALP